MGQGGYLNLVNATPHTWIRTGIHSYQMNKWDSAFPESLIPGQQARCNIEFQSGIGSGDDGGEVTYSIQGTSLSFELQARGRPDFHLQVDWRNTPGNGFFVFPPPGSNPRNIGWMPDGTLTAVVGYLSGKDSQPSVGAGPWQAQWMALYAPVLKNLTVRGLTLPASHDCATYAMLDIVTNPWTQTQDISIYEQLRAGARALDLRVIYGCDETEDGNCRFILGHELEYSSVTVEDALDQIKRFSDENPQEIIVLDFHRFLVDDPNGRKQFDFPGLIWLIKDRLHNRMIPPSDQGKSLHDLWKSGNQRLVVAFWEAPSDRAFWPGVDQVWAGPGVLTWKELETRMYNPLSSPPEGLWGLQGCLPALPLPPPPLLSPQLSNKLYGGTGWSWLANGIGVDWIQKTSIPEASVCASFLKGMGGGVWSPVLAPMPTARYGLAAAADAKGNIYAIGGADVNGKPLSTVEVYNPATNTWASLPPMPTARYGLAAAADAKGNIYAIGGANVVSGAPVNTVEVYNPATNTWGTAPSLPYAVQSLAAATDAQGNIYAIGGYNASRVGINNVEVYNPGTKTWSPAPSLVNSAGQPLGLFGMAAATDANKAIYAIGGNDNVKTNEIVNTVEVFIPGTTSWGPRPSMHTARGYLAAATDAQGNIYAVGGTSNGSTPLKTVEVYSPATQAWGPAPPMPTARYGLAAATDAKGNIYAIGGSGANANPLSTVERYTPPVITYSFPAALAAKGAAPS